MPTGSDRKGGKPFRPPRAGNPNLRTYVKAGKPSVTDFKPEPDLVAVPKDDEGDEVNEAISKLKGEDNS